MGSQSNDQDSRQEQLLKLYWNRAGVKRELNSIRKERYELLDRLKDQENAILRAREQLDGLERLLVNPIAAANAMVYFQLRHVWRIAAQKLEQFSSELEQKRFSREKERFHEAALAKRERRISAISGNVEVLRSERIEKTSQLANLETSLESMNTVLRFFRARGLGIEVAEAKQSIEEVDRQIRDLSDLSEKIQGEPLPEVEMLSVEDRRMVNTATIALAQHLVVHFSANNIAMLARDSMRKTVADMRFGDRRECDRMVENIRSRIADLQQDDKLADGVRQRASILAKALSYRNDNDSEPSPFSTQLINASVDPNQKGRRSSDVPISINVIADDYWDLGRFLI